MSFTNFLKNLYFEDKGYLTSQFTFGFEFESFIKRKNFNDFQDTDIYLEEIITWNREILSYYFGKTKENYIPNGYKNLFGHSYFEYIKKENPDFINLKNEIYIPIDYGAGYNKLLCGYCLETNDKIFVEF